MALIQFRNLIYIVLIHVVTFQYWHVNYPDSVEIAAFKVCFAALPFYTYCESEFCFQLQLAVSHFVLDNIFTEYSDFCKDLSRYELQMVEPQDLKVWRSLLQCLDSNSGMKGEFQTFPWHVTCMPMWEELKERWGLSPGDAQTNVSATI
jgi:hypothetical protein